MTAGEQRRTQKAAAESSRCPESGRSSVVPSTNSRCCNTWCCCNVSSHRSWPGSCRKTKSRGIRIANRRVPLIKTQFLHPFYSPWARWALEAVAAGTKENQSRGSRSPVPAARPVPAPPWTRRPPGIDPDSHKNVYLSSAPRCCSCDCSPAVICCGGWTFAQTDRSRTSNDAESRWGRDQSHLEGRNAGQLIINTSNNNSPVNKILPDMVTVPYSKRNTWHCPKNPIHFSKKWDPKSYGGVIPSWVIPDVIPFRAIPDVIPSLALVLG